MVGGIGNEAIRLRASASGTSLADTACPFTFENGTMLVRQEDGNWELDWLEDANTHWNNIEDDALERYRRFIPGVAGQPPTIRAVVFIESKDKMRRVKPLEPNKNLPRVEAKAASPLVTP